MCASSRRRSWRRWSNFIPLRWTTWTSSATKTFPPARKLIDSGVAVALATDYNPGTAPTPSMPFVLSAACTHMKMSPAEAIVGAAYNGACALRLQGRKGSLEPGKDADIAIFDASDHRELAYWFGVNRCRETFLNGVRQTAARINL